MKKEEFDKLSPDARLEYIKIFQGLFTESVHKRMEILPSVSALSAMLLIVATFGDKIIPLNDVVKGVLSLLLIIIPTTLFFYNLDLKTAQKKNLDYTGELLGLDLKNDSEKNRKIISKLIGNLPDIIIYILSILIIVIIYSIWTKSEPISETAKTVPHSLYQSDCLIRQRIREFHRDKL